MRVTAVESTTLVTVSYDDARELLQLEFCSRAVYQYFSVPGLAPPSGPGIVPFGGIVSMDGHDVNTVAIKGARDVQWFVLDLRHEQGFWIRLVVGMLFYDIASRHHKLEVGVSDFPQPHAFLGMPAD